VKQILQQLRSGEMELANAPVPCAGPNQCLIQTTRSLISIGTEKMLVEFSRGNLLQKARSQPDKVKQVLEKIKTDGLLPTVEAVFNRLDEPLPLGYCNAGVVMETEVSGPSSVVRGSCLRFQAGDRVASNGPHAEVVCVPYSLCARIPDEVSDEEAAFTVLASVGLQGIRLAEPALGEKFVVYGLGLIGLVTVQLLRTNGCEVLGIDLDPRRLELARTFGAQAVSGADALEAAHAWTRGKGADGVLITASASTDEIVHNSGQMCRKRGRIVLVGVVGLNLKRSDFFEKELTFQVSCSYGPGRYDESYEQKGQDYPYGFVRWTEQRNFEAVLELMRARRLDVKPLITHRFRFEQAPAAYDLITKDKSALGVILEYSGNPAREKTIEVRDQTSEVRGQKSEFRDQRPVVSAAAAPAPISHLPSSSSVKGPVVPWSRGPVVPTAPVIGVIGAGNFSKMTLMPGLNKAQARIAYVADLNGVAAGHLARKYGAEKATTDYTVILSDPAVNIVFVATGHNLHARFVCEALAAGKNVFVEKPLALSVEELQRILAVLKTTRQPDDRTTGRQDHTTTGGRADRTTGRPDKGTTDHGPRTTDQEPEVSSQSSVVSSPGVPSSVPLLMVGFNRRFSPHSVRMKEWLRGRAEPLAMTMTVNAGMIPSEHWVHDPVRGGGRIIGEACHFIDLMIHLTGSRVKTVSAVMMGSGVAVREDKTSIALGFEDGSVGTVNYFANGSKSYPKELLEVFSQGRVLRLENFRRLTGYGFRGFSRFHTWRQDKGHTAEFAAFLRRVAEGGEPLIPVDKLVNVTLASFAAVTAAQEMRTVMLADEYPLLFPTA
jgi:predicted dehydrogenase/threonine dehydrogenase-like Zn-dependent dehydrogenase